MGPAVSVVYFRLCASAYAGAMARLRVGDNGHVHVMVHCFRCDEVVEASTDGDGPLWCDTCEDDVLGPPSDTGDRSVRWSATGLLLAGQEPEEPRRWTRPKSRGGSIMGAAMLGLERAMFGKVDDDIAIEVVDDEPDDDDPAELHLDEEVHEDSWIRFKD